MGGEPTGGAPEVPDAMVPPAEVTCVFSASEGEQEVNTWMSDVGRVVFNIPWLPDVAGVRTATLRFRGHDLDHPGEEGWVRVNGNPRVALPADEANDNRSERVDLAVDGQVVEGGNRVAFLAFDRPDGSFYRVSNVRLVLTGDVECADPIAPEEPAPPLGRIANATPLGVSAFAGLSPTFPREGLWRILGALERPFTTLLLDFAPVYADHELRMFWPGDVGDREPNEDHLDAIARFIEGYIEATPEAEARHLQIYLFNGPGIRRAGYARAFDLSPEAFDVAVQNDGAVRADISRFAEGLVATVTPYLDEVDVRFVSTLEDNLSRAGARALNRLLRDAGWEGDLGRNPCGCGAGDQQPVGQFIEHHPHSVPETRRLADALEAPDALSNDGWGFFTDSGTGLLGRGSVPEVVAAAQAGGVWFHFWYDPIQGYPIPDQGPRDLRFDDDPATVLGWLAAGVAEPIEPPPEGEPTGDGVEMVQGYREATYSPRRSWVLDCRDYAYSARGDEHEECDARYDPDGTTHGTATFVFEGVTRDLYTVALEGRHTENRNPAGALVRVNGVERRLRQIGEGEYTFVDHGTYMLEGRVEVILDSTREVGSDAVRRVRLRPAQR